PNQVTRPVSNIYYFKKCNNVLNRGELQRLEEEANLIVNRTKDLIDDLAEKTQMATEIFMHHLFNPEKQLSLGDFFSFFFFSLSDSQETQDSQRRKLKLCPGDHFHKLKTKTDEQLIMYLLSADTSCEGEGGPDTPALIICSKEFDYLFNQYGSEVDLLGMQDLQFAARQDHQSSDSTFLVFMSHGILDGICGTKHREQQPYILHDDTIFQIFNNHNCQSLKDKPKVILMQACRGKGAGIVWVTDMGEDSAYRYGQSLQCSIWNDAITKTHVEKDFIAFKSSTPRKIKSNGSLFISKRIYYLKEYSLCHHLEEIFRKLGIFLSFQLVSMTRYFYLFPGN
uniref:Uncharacterized protein n=1 Tax=Sus scrofa TaxID=9823 RepID=A0A8D0RNW7_PIG